MILGIDPGKTGAVSVYVDGAWQIFDCPTATVRSGKSLKTQEDAGAMADLLSEQARCAKLDGAQVHAWIESVHSMPGQGVSSCFNFGRNFGTWLGILAALRIPHTTVTPQRWKATIMDGMTKDKDAARIRAGQLFPYLRTDLSLKKHHGRADAVLIGEYGRRILQGAT